MASENTGIRRIVLAAKYSWQGLTTCYRKEEAFRQELWLAIVLVPVALWQGDSNLERAILIGSLFMILIVELLNTGIENTVDRIGGEQHKLSGRAKDMGSAAVMLTILMATMLWLLLLLD